MTMLLIILCNFILSVHELSKIYTNQFLKKYSKERFHQLVSFNQFFSYVFFKNFYFQSVGSFLPLIFRKLFKLDPSWFPPFYNSKNLKIFLFFHIISAVGLIFINEIGSFVDYILVDPCASYLTHAKEFSDVIYSEGNKGLQKEAIHIDLPNDLKTSKLTKHVIQTVIVFIALGIVYATLDTF